MLDCGSEEWRIFSIRRCMTSDTGYGMITQRKSKQKCGMHSESEWSFDKTFCSGQSILSSQRNPGLPMDFELRNSITFDR